MDWKEVESDGKEPSDTVNERFSLIRIDSDRVQLLGISGPSGVQKVDEKLHIAVAHGQITELIVRMHMTIAVDEHDQ